MNRVHSAEQDTEFLVNGEPQDLVWMRDNGYPTNEVALHNTVSEKPNAEDTGYTVHEIETYSKPPELADAVEDTITVYVCHCGDFVYRESPENYTDHTPTEIGSCKHCESVDKSIRAANDASQKSLEEVDE